MSCVLSLLVCVKATHAQPVKTKKEKDLYIGGGVVANTGSFIDNQFSSLPFKGQNIGGAVHFKISKPHLWQYFITGFSQGTYSETKTDNKSHQIYFTADYSRLYPLKNNDNKILLMGGGQFGVLYAKRKFSDFINRKENNDFAVSFAAAFSAEYSFKKGDKDGWIISNHLSIPFLSLIQQPVFGTDESSSNVTENKNTVSSFFRNSRITSFNNFLRICNTLQLQKKFTEKKGVSAAYSWDYYQLTTIVKSAQVRHSATISYFFKL